MANLVIPIRNKKNNFRSLVINICFAIAAGFYLALVAKPQTIDDPKQLIAPPALLKHFTFGYTENFSDGLWIRVIQDIGYCEERPEAEIASNVRSDKSCDRGWVYQMLNAITELTPKFRIVYTMGATSLSVLVEDRAGAAALFERGIQNFPNDWSILYRASYHYLVEMGDPVRAADLLVRAGNNGAPVWVYSLAGKLYTTHGQALVAKTVLEDALEQHKDSRYALRLKSRLEVVNRVLQTSDKSEIDKPLKDTFEDTRAGMSKSGD